MNSQECSVLFHKKVDEEEKTIGQANMEIKKLKDSQVHFKSLERENKRLIKTVEKLLKEVGEKKQEIMKLSMKRDFSGIQIQKSREEPVEKESKMIATTNHLRALLLFFKIEKGNTKEICKKTEVSLCQCRDGLKFLKQVGLIKEKGGVYYK